MADDEPEHAVIVRLVLSDGLGSEAERARVHELEDRLARAIHAAQVGELDGIEFGQGAAVLYMYGPKRTPSSTSATRTPGLGRWKGAAMPAGSCRCRRCR